ncbi:MAG: hypothetical protein AB7S26_01000 [Sandaracinaceae bacterium]
MPALAAVQHIFESIEASRDVDVDVQEDEDVHDGRPSGPTL